MNKNNSDRQKEGQVANQGNKQKETQDEQQRQQGRGLDGGRLNDPISQSGSDRSNQQVQSGSDRHAQKPMPGGAFRKETGSAETGEDKENKKIA
jgi:hypothetical protein